MTRALSVLLLTTLLAAGTASATTLHFGTTTANPPFETVNAKNQPSGFDIDLAKALCKQMQAECKFTPQDFNTLIPALRFKNSMPSLPVLKSFPCAKSRLPLPSPIVKRSPAWW